MSGSRVLIVLAVVLVAGAGVAQGQFGRRLFQPQVANDLDFDGLFHYCRLVYGSALNGRGGGWTTDYPNADINMSIRLSELTTIDVSKDGTGQPNHLLVRIDGDELFQCPLVIMSAPERAFITDDQALRLREYLLKGGMLWTDDSWGTSQWQQWVGQLRKVFPAGEYPIFDLPLDHVLFRTQFEVTEIPQIPSINFFMRSGGGTSEWGADSAVPYVRAIADDAGRLMVLMTHNTDIQDSWEREGDDASYFYAFSPRGYAFGINAILYALTH
jgi:hypothetical protein